MRNGRGLLVVAGHSEEEKKWEREREFASGKYRVGKGSPLNMII